MTFVRIGLIVTGRGEAKFLPRLFRALMASASCHFEILRRSEQLDPITAPRRKREMVGKGQAVLPKDIEQYGLPAKRHLLAHQNSFVVVIDDLEHGRQLLAPAIFARYRAALDAKLALPEFQVRASVHFLVNMLEAYYFAHADAVNTVAGRAILAVDHDGDVESIRHPKGDLMVLWPEFHEIDHGEPILQVLDLAHVLSISDRCCSLRTLVAWCVAKLEASGAIHDPSISERFRLEDGCRSNLTANQ